jgi:GNAT superfamily N-acetyltransferase
MDISLRPVRANDFEYCERLYFDGMKSVIEELKLDRAAHAHGFREQWVITEGEIITLDDSDVGWLQLKILDEGLFIAQLFVDAAFRCRGIGTAVMERLIAEAERTKRPLLLAVVKTNPAVRLYGRLAFQVTHEDERKFYMKREPQLS